MVEEEIWSSIPVYTKNLLVSWFDNKELLLGANKQSINTIIGPSPKIRSSLAPELMVVVVLLVFGKITTVTNEKQ